VDPGDLGLLVDGQQDGAAGLEYPHEPVDGPQRIGGVVDRAPGPDDVEGRVGVGQMEHVLLLKAGVGQVELLLQALGRAQAAGADVDARDLSGAVLGENDGENARAAPRVQYGLALHFVRGEKQQPVLFRGVVLGDVFRPDDVVERADFFLIHGQIL
jgi:hypothetical protein